MVTVARGTLVHLRTHLGEASDGETSHVLNPWVEFKRELNFQLFSVGECRISP